MHGSRTNHAPLQIALHPTRALRSPLFALCTHHTVAIGGLCNSLHLHTGLPADASAGQRAALSESHGVQAIVEGGERGCRWLKRNWREMHTATGSRDVPLLLALEWSGQGPGICPRETSRRAGSRKILLPRLIACALRDSLQCKLP